MHAQVSTECVFGPNGMARFSCALFFQICLGLMNLRLPPSLQWTSLPWMSLRWVHLLAGVLILALVTAGCDSGMDDPPPPTEDPTTIADIVADDGNFSTLLSLLQDEGLTDALGDEDATFTVFAPTNAAFGPYDLDAIAGTEGAVGSILRYHVVEGAAVAAGDLTDGQTIETLAGDEVTVSIQDGNVFIDGSQVTQADVEADNGIVHVIDRTLIGNQNLANVAAFVGETSALFDALAGAGLGEAVAGAENWTVFGPNNSAFESADLSGFTESEIAEILQYHVFADGTVDSASLLALLSDEGGETTLETLQGEDLTVALDGEQVVFNDGQATLDVDNLDYFASNGILHVIDGLLVPPSLSASTIAGIVADGDSFTTLDAALGATGLDATLDDRDATFTVFAPADASFAPYDVDFLVDNPDLLSEVLGFHVVQGAAVFASDLSDGDTFTTVQGDEVEIAIEGGDIFVEGAQVTTADVEAANGVVHVVDDVLLTNRTAVERATVTSAFSILADLVGETGLADALSEPGPDGEDGITIFAPTNDAFLAALDANGNGTIDDDEIPSNAADILQYHVLDDVFFAADVPTTETALPTLQGADVTVVRSGSDVFINPSDENASVIAPDVEASNGVIHGIDTVLVIPPSQ